MKNFLTCIILSINFLTVCAQQDRFIYLQTENKQPFFVKLDNKVFNSYPSGYLVISKLDQGVYTLVIGFPGGSSEHQFNCSVKNNDIGFIIKNGGDNWQLLNVQTLDVTVATDVITKPDIAYERATDRFSRMLANAVNDSTILRKDVAIENITEKPGQKDTAAVVTNSNVVVSDNALVADSSNKDVAIVIPEKIADTLQKDSSALVINTDVAILRTDSILTSDSAKTDIAKEARPQKIIEQNQKDTAHTVIPNEVISKQENVVRRDSAGNNETVKIVPEKSGEILKDSAVVISQDDVATTKASKRKRARKDKNAIQDSSVVKNEVVKENIPDIKTDTSSSVLPGDNAVLVKSVIKRKSRKNSRDGLEMLYVDSYGDTNDTIAVFMPSDKKKRQDDEIKITEPAVSVTDVPKEDKPKVTEKDRPDYKITKEEKSIIKEANKDILISKMINSDCKNFATDGDFLKIRKKMVAEDNEEDMIKAARKIFKTRCFTTEQIKNLSVLFLKDEGKFMFFEAAYPFVSDSDLYYSLQSQLTDTVYISRFKAMINK